MTTSALAESIRRRVQTALDAGCCPPIREALVLDETRSTQDVARDAGRTGLVVLALHQTGGRGRLGRAWHAAPGQSLACTLALPPNLLDGPRLSLAAGVATLRACEALMPPSSRGVLGLRWPNDVVERRAPGRKIAGILVEGSPGALLLGVGINLAQLPADWPEHLAGRAVSLRELAGGNAPSDDLPAVGESCVALLGTLAAVLAEPFDATLAAWGDADTLAGTRRVFMHDGVRVEGLVRGVDPLSHLEVETPAGVVRLPALTTSLVHEEARGA